MLTITCTCNNMKSDSQIEEARGSQWFSVHDSGL